ncbi:EamA family transporter [Sporosalibacterium faouarense]|uniref:EamA family transporter n=1 Tax=Sporosalibacterium faouarense TaxID=516123 RepID=UPI001FAED0C3|nr:EamA family transporter [Sporosalibacterium faouarense]
MIIVIAASVLYHISQKSIGENVSPIISMIVTYIVALVLSLIALIFFPSKDIVSSVKELNWASYVLGISVFAIEIGFLLVYRSGWSINVTALFSNIITTIILIFIGIYLLKEQISPVNMVGIGLSIIGLILMQK